MRALECASGPHSLMHFGHASVPSCLEEEHSTSCSHTVLSGHVEHAVQETSSQGDIEIPQNSFQCYFNFQTAKGAHQQGNRKNISQLLRTAWGLFFLASSEIQFSLHRDWRPRTIKYLPSRHPNHYSVHKCNSPLLPFSFFHTPQYIVEIYQVPWFA